MAISIAPDRSAAAQGTPLEDYATTTADELRGFEDGFEVKGSRPLGGPYDAVEVYGTAGLATGWTRRSR